MLDEGIDVPDANLGVVMSASRTRRQMIQRMGRILRRKRPGVAARFVIMFAKDTLEDPANRIERDGFLDEIERISEATGVFDSARVRASSTRSSRAPGPEVVPEPEHLERYDAAVPPPASRRRASLDEATVAHAGATARRRDGVRAAHVRRATRRTRAATPAIARSRPAPAAGRRDSAPYLELELAELPQIAKPKVEPKRLSTGQVPLEIARSAPRGASAAPAAARRRRSWSSAGRCSTRPSPAAATELRSFLLSGQRSSRGPRTPGRPQGHLLPVKVSSPAARSVPQPLGPTTVPSTRSRHR